MKKTNLISWVEVPAKDFGRAVKFYESVFDLKLNVNDFGEEKMACFPGGEGAISLAPDFNPAKDGVLVSFNVENKIDEAIKKVELNGGEIVQSKTKIEAEGRDYFALFIDSEGNKAGLYGN